MTIDLSEVSSFQREARAKEIAAAEAAKKASSKKPTESTESTKSK